MAEWMLPAEAARVLQISASGVRWLVDTHRLESVRTVTGVRLLHRRHVRRLAARRARQQASEGRR